MRRFLRKLKGQSGQGMSEYLIIVALIAVAAIGVVTVFGQDIRDLFQASTGALAGQTNNQSAATKANVANKNLKNFSKSTQNGD